MDNTQSVMQACTAPLLTWYEHHKRELPWRGVCDPYAVWVSEIMLQQTRVNAVIPYYTRWMQELPDVFALAAVDEERLMKLWQGLGYYSRAKNLKKAAQKIVTDYGGQFPDTYAALLTLPGVGEYTAAAIASIAFGRRVSAVDGNLLRVAARVEDIRTDILDGATRKTIRALLERAIPHAQPGAFNQALMDLGATVCLPNGRPLCEACPLADLCRAHLLGIEQELPVRAKRAPRRCEEMTVYLLLRSGQVALRRREDSGLLAGLWEFPHVSGTQEESAAGEPLEAWHLTALDWQKKLRAKHCFTHVEWHMTGYLLAVQGEGPDTFLWADKGTLEQLAVPAAFKKYLAVCLDALQEQQE